MTTTLADHNLSAHLKRLKLLYYGPFGTWKTVNAHRMPRTRTLDFDDGLLSVLWAIKAGKIERDLKDVVFETIVPPATMDEDKNNVFDLATDKVEQWVEDEDVDPSQWEEYCKDQNNGLVYPQFWDTLIIDSGSSLAYSTLIKALKETNRLELSQSWKKRKIKGLTPRMIQDYGATSILFEKFMKLCYGTGKNIVLICHEYINTDKKGNLVSIQPLLPGQLRESLPKDFDEVWYARVKGAGDKQRGLFQTKRDPLRGCRSRLGCLDAEEFADFDAIKEKVGKFYGVSPEQLWTGVHGTEAARELEKEEAKEAVMA